MAQAGRHEVDLEQLERAAQAAEGVTAALREATRAAAELRRLRALVAELQEEKDAARRAADEAAARSRAEYGGAAARGARTVGAEDAAAALGAMLSAPFRVTGPAASAARTEPLIALAVQVAKALDPQAKELERARLIAMAFAASRGDLDAFWAARKQRRVDGDTKPARRRAR